MELPVYEPVDANFQIFLYHDFRQSPLPGFSEGLRRSWRIWANLERGRCWCGRSKAFHPAPNSMSCNSKKLNFKGRKTSITCNSGLFQKLLEDFKNKCAYCDSDLSVPTIDHEIPFSRGGADQPHNIVPACPKCNAEKHNLTALEYLWELAGDQHSPTPRHTRISLMKRRISETTTSLILERS